MNNAPAPLLAHIAQWSDPARDALWVCRTIYHDTASDLGIGALDETLKWQQPSWRPVRPRTGSTLRMGWDPQLPERLAFFVDCKTDLASRMRDIYSDFGENDGQRKISADLTRPLPQDAISHLAHMTFSYHLSAARLAKIG